MKKIAIHVFLLFALLSNVYANNIDKNNKFINGIEILYQTYEIIYLQTIYINYLNFVENVKETEKTKYIKHLYKDYIDKYGDICKNNTEILKKIINNIHKWEKLHDNNETLERLVFNVILYADHDREFQNKCLKLIKKANKKGKCYQCLYSFLKDKLLVLDGKEQLFGTQYKITEDEKLYIYPIKNEANLSKRCNRYGLSKDALNDMYNFELKIYKDENYRKQSLHELRIFLENPKILTSLNKMNLNIIIYNNYIRKANDQDKIVYFDKYGDINKLNADKLKDLINKTDGLIFTQKYSKFSNWIVLQVIFYADYDRDFQVKCLVKIEEAIKNKEFTKYMFPYLKDKILIYQGKKQVFGTQGELDKNGDWQVYPIEDENELANRRKEYNLTVTNLNFYIKNGYLNKCVK